MKWTKEDPPRGTSGYYFVHTSHLGVTIVFWALTEWCLMDKRWVTHRSEEPVKLPDPPNKVTESKRVVAQREDDCVVLVDELIAAGQALSAWYARKPDSLTNANLQNAMKKLTELRTKVLEAMKGTAP